MFFIILFTTLNRQPKLTESMKHISNKQWYKDIHLLVHLEP